MPGISVEQYSLVQSLIAQSVLSYSGDLKVDTSKPLQEGIYEIPLGDTLSFDDLNLVEVPNFPTNREEIIQLLIQRGGWSLEELQFYSLIDLQMLLMSSDILQASFNIQGAFILSRPTSNPFLSYQLLQALPREFGVVAQYWNSTYFTTQVDQLWMSRLQAYLQQMALIRVASLLLQAQYQMSFKSDPFYNPYLEYRQPVRETEMPDVSSDFKVPKRAQVKPAPGPKTEVEGKADKVGPEPGVQERQGKPEKVDGEKAVTSKATKPKTGDAPIINFLKRLKIFFQRVDNYLEKKEKDLEQHLNVATGLVNKGISTYQKVRDILSSSGGPWSEIFSGIDNVRQSLTQVGIATIASARSAIKGIISLLDRLMGNPEDAEKELNEALEEYNKQLKNLMEASMKSLKAIVDLTKGLVDIIKDDPDLQRRLIRYFMRLLDVREAGPEMLAKFGDLSGIVDVITGGLDLIEGGFDLTIGNYFNYQDFKRIQGIKVRYPWEKEIKDIAVKYKVWAIALNNISAALNIGEGIGSLINGIGSLTAHTASIAGAPVTLGASAAVGNTATAVANTAGNGVDGIFKITGAILSGLSFLFDAVAEKLALSLS